LNSSRKPKKLIKLIIFFNVPIYYTQNEKYFSADFINALDFFLEVAHNVEYLTLCIPASSKGNGPVKIDMPDNMNILSLPYYCGEFGLLKQGYKVIPSLLLIAIRKIIKNYDAVGIVAPGIISSIVAPTVHFFHDKPIFFIVRGDKQKTIHFAFKNSFYKRDFIKSVIYLTDLFLRWLLKKEKTIMFTIGRMETYNYVKTKIFTLSPVIPNSIISQKSDFSIEAKDILYVGRLSGEKGVSDLVSAFAEIIKEGYDNLTLHIVGSGPEEKLLRTKAIKLGILKKVKFHGFIPRGNQLWNLFDKSQIFVLPSYTEGLPRGLFEAMARGLAVVATNVGGIPNKIIDGENGLLVRPGDVRGLKEAIQKLIQDSELRRRVVTKGYKTVSEVTFQKQAKQMIEIINKKLLINKQ